MNMMMMIMMKIINIVAACYLAACPDANCKWIQHKTWQVMFWSLCYHHYYYYYFCYHYYNRVRTLLEKPWKCLNFVYLPFWPGKCLNFTIAPWKTGKSTRWTEPCPAIAITGRSHLGFLSIDRWCSLLLLPAWQAGGQISCHGCWVNR